MRASSCWTDAGSSTSTSAPQPARLPGDVQRGRRGQADPRPSVVELAVGVAVPAELVAQDRHEPGLDEHGRPGARAPLLDLVDDLLPGVGQREVVGPLGGLVGDVGVDDPVDPEGALPAFGAGEQVPDVVLVDQAPRVDQPLRTAAGRCWCRSGGPCAGGSRRPAAGRPSRAGWRSRSPHRVGSIIVALAAASASARKVGGSARTSLRSAALASAETAAAGPTSRNSACASVADSPTEVGAGAADQRPPAAPAGLRVDRDAGGRERLEVAAGGGDRHLELVGQLGRGHPAPRLHEQEGGDESVRAHDSRFSIKVLSW